MMAMDDIVFLFDHAEAYGGREYALWTIARFGNGEPGVPGISHPEETVKFQLETGSSSALHHQMNQHPHY